MLSDGWETAVVVAWTGLAALLLLFCVGAAMLGEDYDRAVERELSRPYDQELDR